MADYISAFDVLGPNMIGPSSSHTAGAAVIGFLAQKMIAAPITQADFILYGSFARTYHGHGTDRALLGGVMGFSTDDTRIRDSFQIAKERGLRYSFKADETQTDLHPNTVDVCLENEQGQKMRVRGESLGGGKVRICRINQMQVDFSGQYCTLILIHRDRPGIAAYATKCLSDYHINIAFMRVFREDRGSTAYTVVETDDRLPQALAQDLKQHEHVYEALLVQP